MMLWQHFLACSALAILLYPMFGVAALLVFVSGFLIDIDHPLYFFIKFKEISFKKTYWYFRNIGLRHNREEYQKVIRPFHTIEALGMILVGIFYFPWLSPLVAGWIVHLAMDIIEEWKIFRLLPHFSLVLYLYKQKTL